VSVAAIKLPVSWVCAWVLMLTCLAVNINLNTTQDTKIKGANLQATNQLNIDTKNLEVSSVQNKHKAKTRYLHYDNLGSIDTITDGQGNIVERMSYAAFGERRKGDWRASDPLYRSIEW
jgi:hypothetical protein